MTTINIGDKVSFVRTSMTKHTVRMRAVEGTVEELNGQQARIRMRNGRRTIVHVEHLRHCGQPNALTEAFMSLGSNLEGKQGGEL